MSSLKIAVLSLLFFSNVSWAATTLPKGLNATDRIRALQILGFGSASKILDNPYPLGGYSGIEVGLSSEFIPIEDLARLGTKTTDRGELNYYTLTFGKGLYYNVDTHLYFTPSLQSEKVQAFGGQLRWGFYEAKFFPLSLTSILYAGGANFSNLINISTIGADFVATVSMDNVAIYFGGGKVRAIGKFIGGADGITDNAETVEQDETENHTVFGVSFDVARFFVALEIDRYSDSIYSTKLGFRF
ncbi:hypothetical protein ACES2L_13415 [Bdellovibrio bacteriovorus]